MDEIRISMLRQWLNEDRISDPKKMITNADIKYWLGLIGSEEYREELKKENSLTAKIRNKIAKSVFKYLKN